MTERILLQGGTKSATSRHDALQQLVLRVTVMKEVDTVKPLTALSIVRAWKCSDLVLPVPPHGTVDQGQGVGRQGAGAKNVDCPPYMNEKKRSAIVRDRSLRSQRCTFHVRSLSTCREIIMNANVKCQSRHAVACLLVQRLSQRLSCTLQWVVGGRVSAACPPRVRVSAACPRGRRVAAVLD